MSDSQSKKIACDGLSLRVNLISMSALGLEMVEESNEMSRREKESC